MPHPQQYIGMPQATAIANAGLQINDATDNTKSVDFDVSAVTTATTRTITVGDADFTIGETTDHQLQIPLMAGVGDAGTWTIAASSGGLVTVTRTAGAATESFWVEIPIGNRTAASKGIKPTGLLVNYSVATADATDVRCEVWKVTQGADNAARTAAVLFGDADGDYDAAHNTAAERGDDTTNPELHLATVTDAGTPAYMATGESLLFRFVVQDPGTSDVILTNAVLLYSETEL